nr:hypothetical protein [uncultured Mediterranean phage uvMED]
MSINQIINQKDKDLFNKCLEDLKKQKAVPQHGKNYYTVASRHSVLINNFVGRVTIRSEIIEALCDEAKVAVKVIIDINNWGSFSGLALERYDSSFINKTSALENAETSALGRALAAFGLHGSEFASADELINAKMNQNTTGTNPTFVGVAKNTNLKKFPKQNGKKNSKQRHISQSTIDQIKADIENINDAHSLRNFKKYNPDLFDLTKISVDSYQSISDIYEIRLIQINQGGVN